MTPAGPFQEWRRAVVYGLGVSGLAAARLLRSRGVAVVGVDRRPAAELDLGELAADAAVELELGAEPAAVPAGVDGVVVSPGVPLDRPLLADARRRDLPVLAEVELGFAFAAGPVIGITGSNGKSTTTALTGALLAAGGFEVEVCGNIGVPLSAVVDGAPGRVFVTELSSFQLETVRCFRPRAAALLNLSVDHQDRHAGLDRYLDAKRALFANQLADDVAVLNADDPLVAAVAVNARRRLFSRRRRVEDGCYLDRETVVEAAPGAAPSTLFEAADLALPGVHNLENAMAAALLSRALGAQAAVFGPALGAFQGLPHRLERVRELRGVVWYDDSKGTNLAATAKSLEGFEDGAVHLILGGRHKGGEPDQLAELVGRKARRVYLVGEAAELFGAALDAVAPCERVGDLARAVAAAAAQARPGDSVLLSPACASFDQYNNFAERGRHFQSLVRALDG